MAKNYKFERAKLKGITRQFFLSQNEDQAQVTQALFKKPIRLYLHETIPEVYLSDGFNFIEAQFTKESINDFRKNYSHLRFSALKQKMVMISKWHLKFQYKNSKECFNSYQNISVIFVVEHFKPISHILPDEKQVKKSSSLFSLDEIRVLIKNMRQDYIGSLLEECSKQYPDGQLEVGYLSMPSLSTVNTSHHASQESLTKSICKHGVVRANNLAEDFDQMTVLHSQKAPSDDDENDYDKLIADQDDFPEFKYQLNNLDGEESKAYADVQRLQLLELGEAIYQKKARFIRKAIQHEIDLYYRQLQLNQQNKYYTMDRPTMNLEEWSKRKEEERSSKKHVRRTSVVRKVITGYKLLSAEYLNRKVINILKHNFDGNDCVSESEKDYGKQNRFQSLIDDDEQSPNGILQIRSNTGRPRAYSQENLQHEIGNDDTQGNEMTHCIAGNNFDDLGQNPQGNEALSQFQFNHDGFSQLNEQSQAKGSESDKTESEGDSVEEQEKERVGVLDNNSIIGVELYRKYLMWAIKYKTTTVAREEKEQDIVQQAHVNQRRTRNDTRQYFADNESMESEKDEEVTKPPKIQNSDDEEIYNAQSQTLEQTIQNEPEKVNTAKSPTKDDINLDDLLDENAVKTEQIQASTIKFEVSNVEMSPQKQEVEEKPAEQVQKSPVQEEKVIEKVEEKVQENPQVVSEKPVKVEVQPYIETVLKKVNETSEPKLQDVITEQKSVNMGRRTIRGNFLKADCAEQYYKLIGKTPTTQQEEQIQIKEKSEQDQKAELQQKQSDDVFKQIKEQEQILEEEEEDSYDYDNCKSQLMNNVSQGPSQNSSQDVREQFIHANEREYHQARPVVVKEKVEVVKVEEKKTALSKKDLAGINLDNIFLKLSKHKKYSPLKEDKQSRRQEVKEQNQLLGKRSSQHSQANYGQTKTKRRKHF